MQSGGAPDAKRTARRQAANSVIYLSAPLLTGLVSLVTLPVFTRILSKEEYGLWGLASAYGSVVTGIANFGMSIGFERNFFEAKTDRERGELLYSVIAFVGTMFFLCGVGTWFGRNAISQHLTGSADAAVLFVVGYAAIGLSSLKLYFLSYYRNTHDARSYTKYTLDEVVLGALLSLALVAGFRVGVIGLALGPMVASSVILLLLLRRFMRDVVLGFSLAALRSALAISLPLAPRVLLSGVGAQFDKYVLGLLGTLGAVGIYTVGQRLAAFVGTGMGALQNVYLPHVYERMVAAGPDERPAIVGRYLSPYAFVSIGVALCCSLFADEAFFLLASAEYRGAALIASILAVMNGVTFFGRQPQLQFVKKMKLIGGISILSFVWTILLMIAGTRLLGGAGTAVGSLVAALVTAAVILLFAQKYNPIAYEWKQIVPMLTLLSLAPLLSYLHFRGVLPYAAILVLKLLVLASYLTTGFVAGHLRPEALKALVRRPGSL